MLAFRTALNPVPPPSDPYYANVSLLLHFDGSNGSTVFKDSGPNNLAVTANGSANITTGDYKYGTGSLAVVGSTSRVQVASNPLFAFGTGNFTAETWVKFNAIPSGAGGAGSAANAETSLFNVNVSGGFAFYYAGTGGYYSVYNSLVVSNRQSNQLVSAWSPTVGQWYHIAVSRSGTSLKIFIDGNQIGSATSSTNYAQGILQIGGSSDAAASSNILLDETRFTKPIARYTANFTPPSGPFPNS